MGLRKDPADLNRFTSDCRPDIQVLCALIYLSGGDRFSFESGADISRQPVADVSGPSRVSRDRDGYLCAVVGFDSRSVVVGQVLQVLVRSEAGLDSDGTSRPRILIKTNKEMASPQSLECKYTGIHKALQCCSGSDSFMN